jgi:hypothetical protein
MVDGWAKSPPPMEKLLALLPDPANFPQDEFGCHPGLYEAATAALPALREATGGCPACIMAALRQRGLAVKGVEGFGFTEECKAWWAEFNEERLRKSEAQERSYRGI